MVCLTTTKIMNREYIQTIMDKTVAEDLHFTWYGCGPSALIRGNKNIKKMTLERTIPISSLSGC